MENHALEIIDMLYTMIAEAWGVPLGNDKCIVERDKALGLLDDLKVVLPLELTEARRLVNAREEFVGSAKQEADSIRRSAEEEASRLLEGQSVYIAAQKKAEKSARSYWNGRLYEKRRGRPGILRACAVLLCGFAALSAADRVIPSMTLRPLLLAAAALAGVIWGAAMQYALRGVLMRSRRRSASLRGVRR